MYCEKCGAQIDDDSVFCEKCGKKQDDMEHKQNSVAAKKLSRGEKGAIIFAAVFTTIVAIFTVIVISTHGVSSDGGSSASINGRWVNNADLFGVSFLVTIEFSGNGDYIRYNDLPTFSSNIIRQGTYTRSGNTITVKYGYDSIATYTYDPTSDTISDSHGSIFRRR